MAIPENVENTAPCIVSDPDPKFGKKESIIATKPTSIHPINPTLSITPLMRHISAG